MAIPTDKAAKAKLPKVVGPRLRAARLASGMTMAAAADRLKHKGVTQVSLAEDGHRLPPIHDLLKYADLYCVSVDYLLGRIDDPIAETSEHGHGLMVRAVQSSIQDLFSKFSGAVAEHAAVSLCGVREERQDLIEVCGIGEEASAALSRIRELNPEFDDLRGGSKLEAALAKLAVVGRRIERRSRNARLQYEMIDRSLDLVHVGTRVEQFRLRFDVAPLVGEEPAN